MLLWKSWIRRGRKNSTRTECVVEALHTNTRVGRRLGRITQVKGNECIMVIIIVCDHVDLTV